MRPSVDSDRSGLCEKAERVSATAERHRGTMWVHTVRHDPDTANVRVSGELDLSTAAPLWAVLQGHLAAGRRYLRLDVSGVTFLDATALSGITSVHQSLLGRRGTLVLTGVQSLVAKVLHLTGLDEVLFVGGSRGEDDITVRA